MTQERDDYMRRQAADHALLDMRDPTYRPQNPTRGQTQYRSLSTLLKHTFSPQPMPTAALRYLENDPCDDMLPSDLEIVRYVSVNPTWQDDLHQRLADIWGIPRSEAKERTLATLYGNGWRKG